MGRWLIHLDLATRENLFLRYGSFALAYSVAYQPEMLYFGDKHGALAYRTVGKSALVLSNPLAPPELWPGLIDSFAAKMGDVSFWQVSRSMAVLLASRGFLVNAMGFESNLDLRTYSFDGPRKRNFRTAANRMAAQGLQTREALASAVNFHQLKNISEKWRQTRTVKSRELTFLIRPVVLDDEKGVRKFFTFNADGLPVGFASFDPLFTDGTLTGYLMATKRCLPDADPLVSYDLVRCAIETFQREGLELLRLGMSPFAQVKDKDFVYSRSVKQSLHFFRSKNFFNRYIYPVRGISQHKSSFFGDHETVYCAFNRRPGIIRLIKMSRACGII